MPSRRKSLTSHHRTYSWPPSLQLVDHSFSAPLPDIDEDPFAHFISPVTEEDDPLDNVVFGAGIILTESVESKSSRFRTIIAKKWARYIATHHGGLHRLYHVVERKPPPESSVEEVDADEDYLTMPPRIKITDTSEPTRGRAQEIVALSHPRRGRRLSRTLSGHRRSWREPSVDLFTVMEEVENGGAELDRRTIRMGDGPRLLSEPVERSRL